MKNGCYLDRLITALFVVLGTLPALWGGLQPWNP
jgi:hypothetical protein